METFNYGIDHLTASKALMILNGSLKGLISAAAEAKIITCHEEVLAIANEEKAVYGINTGFGPLCNTKIKKEDVVELQRRLLLSHSVGVGDPISKDMSKLMLILKVHSLSKAFSGISMKVLNRILWQIENDVIPVVPCQGSVGASGDLAPLSHLFIPLIGEGEVFYKGKTCPTIEALNAEDVLPLTLHPKAGLALINGTQFIAAHAVMIVDQLKNCLDHADIIAALMIEGLKGSASPFKAILHQTRPHKGNVHVAHRMEKLLHNSEILESHKNCDKVQDPYSMRCVPQVHGSSRSAWLHLKEAVEVEINSVTDNPIVFSRELTISGGNFHGQPLALPLDYACLAAAELGNISDRRSYLSLEGKTDGVPKLLVKETGINSGFMIVQYTGAALVSENKSLCYPASADSIPTSLGQEDHVSMGSISGRKTLQVCNNLANVLAIELLCAAQAFDFHRPLKSSDALEKVHAELRKHVSHCTEDRIFAPDIANARKVIDSKVLVTLINESRNEAWSEFDELFEQY